MAMMEGKAFNINESIYVRLTEEGYAAWEKYYGHIFQKGHRLYKSINQLKGEADSNGYHKFQLWDFIDIFGEHINMGARPVIQGNDIIFQEKSFRPIEV